MRGRLQVHAVGFAAPGVEGAEALRSHLAGASVAPADEWTPVPESISRRQALRLSDATRLAIMVAEQIGPALPAEAPWIFASSSGEGQTLHEILVALRADEIMIQPIRFQNAVHNAAQGQWSIAAGATGPMTSIAAYDDTAGAGLLKALMEATLENSPVALVIFDAPMPPPLHEKRPFTVPMAAALVLSPVAAGPDCPSIVFDLDDTAKATPLDSSHAAPLFTQSGNPVRFMLPLLERILLGKPGDIVLQLPGRAALRLTVESGGNA